MWNFLTMTGAYYAQLVEEMKVASVGMDLARQRRGIAAPTRQEGNIALQAALDTDVCGQC